MKRDSAKKLLICSYKWFFCHDFANVIYSQTAKTVFSHLIIRFSKWCENEKQKAKFKSVFQCHAKTKNVNGIWIPIFHAIEKRLALRYTHLTWSRILMYLRNTVGKRHKKNSNSFSATEIYGFETALPFAVHRNRWWRKWRSKVKVFKIRAIKGDGKPTRLLPHGKMLLVPITFFSSAG